MRPRRIAADYIVGGFWSLEDLSTGAEQAPQDAQRPTSLDLDVPIEAIDDEPRRRIPAYYDTARLVIVFNTASGGTRAEAAQYIAEELLHAVDAVGPRRTLSARSTVIDEIIAPEANRHYDGGGEFAEFLDYPLNGEHGLTKSETKAELFARLGVLYFGDPDAMRRALPQTYEVFHDTFGFAETGPLGGGRILRQVQGTPAAQPRQAGEPTGAGERVSGGPAQSGGERRTDTGLERLRRQIVQHFATTPEGGIVQFSRYDAGHPEGFSDAYLAHQDEITQRIYDIARQLAPKADLQVVRQLFGRGEALIASGASTGAPREVAGMFNPAANLIVASLRYENPEATVRHEAVHALKSMGLFSPTEWQSLERESNRIWMDKYGVPDSEEGVAYAFQDFRQGEPQKGFIGSAFRKIRDFLQRLGNVLRGLGFQIPEDVFRRAESDEVGRRSLWRKMDTHIEDTNDGIFGHISLESFRDDRVCQACASDALSEPGQGQGQTADRTREEGGRFEEAGGYSLAQGSLFENCPKPQEAVHLTQLQ